MELQIVIENLDPPCGRGVLDGLDVWQFAGWLELIEKVERLKDEPAAHEPAEESDGVP